VANLIHTPEQVLILYAWHKPKRDLGELKQKRNMQDQTKETYITTSIAPAKKKRHCNTNKEMEAKKIKRDLCKKKSLYKKKLKTISAPVQHSATHCDTL